MLFSLEMESQYFCRTFFIAQVLLVYANMLSSMLKVCSFFFFFLVISGYDIYR